MAAQRVLGCGLLALLLAAALPAQAFDEVAIEALVQQRLAASDAPGVAVVIRQGETAPWVRAYGMADLEQGSPMQPATVIPIESVTKVFTSLAILLLEQDGKLSTGDALSRFLPDYPGGDGITLAQLLTHTAGVANFVTVPVFADNQAKD